MRKNLPREGWTYLQQIDTTETGKTARCDICNKVTRYKHLLSHPKAGIIGVGCKCADNLTGTDIASKKDKLAQSLESRSTTLLQSPKWKHRGNVYELSHKGFVINITETDGWYSLKLTFEVLKDGDFPIWETQSISPKYRFSSMQTVVQYAMNCMESDYYAKYLRNI
ncbi:MAG: hypothetical protein KBT34_10540 [Prevotella sp.]|nr:hypothetical protein [Candidatus Prevotella equi]